jgi:ComF family protein
VGERDGVLQRLIGLYKFERAKEAYKQLGDLLHAALPDLPADTVIVPVPTTFSRIRERGYDHMLLIAQYAAKKRRLTCDQLLIRKNDTKQRHATAKVRNEQAANAFSVMKPINADVPYLILDDVMTTGATLKYAAKTLKDAGAKHVWVGVIARQALD